jgi:hypothetical protein
MSQYQGRWMELYIFCYMVDRFYLPCSVARQCTCLDVCTAAGYELCHYHSTPIPHCRLTVNCAVTTSIHSVVQLAARYLRASLSVANEHIWGQAAKVSGQGK